MHLLGCYIMWCAVCVSLKHIVFVFVAAIVVFMDLSFYEVQRRFMVQGLRFRGLEA